MVLLRVGVSGAGHASSGVVTTFDGGILPPGTAIPTPLYVKIG